MTKLPVSLFTNYEPGGPLCHILAVAHQMKAEQTWRRFDFVSPARMNRNVELFVNVLKDLQTAKLWEPPVVYFDGSLDPDEAVRLAEIVKRQNVSCGCGCGCGWWVVKVKPQIWHTCNAITGSPTPTSCYTEPASERGQGDGDSALVSGQW